MQPFAKLPAAADDRARRRMATPLLTARQVSLPASEQNLIRGSVTSIRLYGAPIGKAQPVL